MSLIVTMVALAIGLCVPPLAWDKPTALAWENRADMMASAGRRRLGSSFVAHPVSSIQWATFDGDEEDERPRSWRFVNSAQRAIALPMDWPSVFDAAMAMERVHSMPDEVVVDVVRGTHAGAMPAVATQASLERALAAALVGRPVLAREVEGPTGVCCTSPEPLVPTEGLRLGSMHRSRVGAELRMDPAVVSLSRSTMPLCWPKAFHFAKMLRHDGDAAFDERLGAIPVCWDVVRGRWMAQHRHRVLGGLLAGVDLLVVMGNEHALADGTTWRLPSKTRLTLARHAADLLAISSRSHADLLAAHVAGASAAADAPSTEHAKLLRRAREALRKAPAECDLLGISADLRSVLWKAEQAKRRNVEARQPRSKASQAEGAATVQQTTATLAADAIASAERQPPSPASSIPSEMPSEGRSSGRDAIWASVMPSEGRSSGRGQATQQPADGLADPLVAGIDASERRATRPRGVDEVTAAAIAVGPPETGSAAASALSSAPSFAPLARAGIQTGRPVELLGGVFSLREEVCYVHALAMLGRVSLSAEVWRGPRAVGACVPHAACGDAAHAAHAAHPAHAIRCAAPLPPHAHDTQVCVHPWCCRPQRAGAPASRVLPDRPWARDNHRRWAHDDSSGWRSAARRDV